MKNISKYILALVSLLTVSALFTPQIAKADGDGSNGIVTTKTVSGPNTDGIYTLTLESYVTAKTVTTITEGRAPADIALVLDVSGSMEEQIDMGSIRDVANDMGRLNKIKGATEGYYYFKVFLGISTYEIKWDPSWNNGDGTYGHWVYYKKLDTLKGKKGWYTLEWLDDNYSIISGATLWCSDTKIEALKEAACNFIDTINADAVANNVEHQISIIKYASNQYYSSNHLDEGNHRGAGSSSYNYSEIVKNFRKVGNGLGANVTELKAAINSLVEGGATAADYGMQLATDEFNSSYARNNTARTVVFFTDGDPNHDSGFSTSVANTSVEKSKSFKDGGTTVFSVGILGDPSSNQTNFMNAMSSNYPDATAYNSLGTKASSNYYWNVSAAADLNTIFQTIAQSATSGSAVVTTLTQTATVLDVVTKSFQIPSGTAGTIKAYTANCTGVNGSGDLQFASRVAFNDAVINTAVQTDGTTNVTVSNFNFSENFCGIHDGGSYGGKKLIIEIPIEPKADAVGGKNIPTNGATSGLYPDINEDPIETYPIPDVDLPVNISIKKTGLKVGDSATFIIKKKTSTGWEYFTTVILTATTANPTPVVKLVKLEPEIYKIEESGWSWAYTTQNATGTDVTTEGVEINPFEFTNTVKSNTARHAEATVSNDFKTSTATVKR